MAQVHPCFAQKGRLENKPKARIPSVSGSSLRDECLNVHWFLSLEDAKMKIERWRKDYNEYRPHSGLTYRRRLTLPKPRGFQPFRHKNFHFIPGPIFGGQPRKPVAVNSEYM